MEPTVKTLKDFTATRNQMVMRNREMVPRPMAYAMFGLMAATVLFVAWARLTDQPLTGVLVEAPVVQERLIVLDGNRSGPWTALDAATGEVLASSDVDKAGFIGVIGQSVRRSRTVAGADLTAPLRIVRRDNGQIGIIDDTTGEVIELIGYGDDNVAAFARLLEN